jgi:hypothetical protein
MKYAMMVLLAVLLAVILTGCETLKGFQVDNLPGPVWSVDCNTYTDGDDALSTEKFVCHVTFSNMPGMVQSVDCGPVLSDGNGEYLDQAGATCHIVGVYAD